MYKELRLSLSAVTAPIRNIERHDHDIATRTNRRSIAALSLSKYATTVVFPPELRHNEDIKLPSFPHSRSQSSVDDGAWPLTVRNSKGRILRKMVELARISVMLALSPFVNTILLVFSIKQEKETQKLTAN